MVRLATSPTASEARRHFSKTRFTATSDGVWELVIPFTCGGPMKVSFTLHRVVNVKLFRFVYTKRLYIRVGRWFRNYKTMLVQKFTTVWFRNHETLLLHRGKALNLVWLPKKGAFVAGSAEPNW